MATLPTLLSMPKGDGRPVLLAPGFMADKWSMRPLKGFLNKLGYEAYDWNLGRNNGDVDEDIVRLGRQTLELSSALDKPITLIGWSLGGVLCREVARLFPDVVREVITMGTPVTGGPK
ncbi:alpha/beta fold hydrolase [Alteromonas sp. ASW11-36]|uniref:Alpha/beta fold hydrolase n=1 Tax=Alteromonas arenosi TaxID=3055817 RepID=A0ABT7SSR2_9ALTE|nr:alpha/beta fold hydrolase [Alteromonas sp. ASW11-36]MDM7859233.1 alpha/beta fold hydrolase [Alteromonas sp. ASW11-36]